MNKKIKINDDLLLNKLTEKGLCKFINLYDIEGLSCSNKADMKQKIKELTGEGKLFESIPKANFIKFYLGTEKAGQKHFYFYETDLDKNMLENINTFAEENCTPEEKRNFNTDEDDIWFYQAEGDEIIFKIVNIKEVFQHNSNLDDKSQLSQGKFFRGYNVFKIQNVLFFRFFISRNKLIIGIDKYSDLDTPSDIRKKIVDNYEKICGKKSFEKLNGIINTEAIEKIIFLPNVISHKVKNDININKQSAIYASRGDLTNILNEIDGKKYDISQVKMKNPDFDIRTHPTYLAEQAKKYEDNTLEIDINNCELYWFTHHYKKADCFRLKISSVDSSITTFSSSITDLEFEDVVHEII
jgi:hypothetical protein